MVVSSPHLEGVPIAALPRSVGRETPAPNWPSRRVSGSVPHTRHSLQERSQHRLASKLPRAERDGHDGPPGRSHLLQEPPRPRRRAAPGRQDRRARATVLIQGWLNSSPASFQTGLGGPLVQGAYRGASSWSPQGFSLHAVRPSHVPRISRPLYSPNLLVLV